MTNNINFRLKCEGIAFFSGPEVIIYIPITVTTTLLELHNELYNQVIRPLLGRIVNSNPYYYPNNWIPHITVIQIKEKGKNFNEIFENVLVLNNTYEFTADNLALIDSNNNIIFEIN